MENELRENILSEYNAYKECYGEEPNIVYVKIRWNGEKEVEDCVFEIAFDSSSEVYKLVKDDEVLYYCSGIDEFLTLIDDNNHSDFVVTSLVGFDRAC